MQKLIRDIASQKPDAIAIAGDIGEGIENISIALEEFASLKVPVAACAGNHDVWNTDKKHPSKVLWERSLPKLARSTGTTWLDNDNLVAGDTAIVGTIGWYDYSAQDPSFKASDEENWTRKGEFDADAWMCDWPWNDIEFCGMIEPGFRERLQRAENDPTVHRIIVISHSPLFEEQMKRKPDNAKWGFTNAYYGNLTFGKIVSEFSKVTHAYAGHTHAGMEGKTVIGGHPAKVVALNSQYEDPVYIKLDT
jgi:predicted MPP superfamily phosphohydrolase